MKDPLIENRPANKSSLIIWLFVGCFMIFTMVVVGGITRLTGSGLSITEWKVVTGVIPPLSQTEWEMEFFKYQQIPQYQLINSHFTLDDFKFIYFWEYIHRLIGRTIGLVFLYGLLTYYMRGVISKQLMPRLLFMFVLGGIQGFLGWYMVSSGLTENVRVSHIRLAIHLTFAFITFGYIFWVALTQLFPVKYANSNAYTRYKKYGWTLLGLVILQVIYGAFVAGTKAGMVYTTWPMMEGEWVPESMTYMLQKDGISSLINNLASVQFIHRSLAYLITIIVVALILKVWKDKQLEAGQKKSAYVLGGLVVLQIILGIYTLLNSVPVALGVIHQATAFFVFATTIYFIYRLAYASMNEKIAFVDDEE